MIEKKFKEVGARLELERERLNIKNKSAMAALGGVVPSAYGNYADGIRAPDGAFLIAIASAGADVQYILTGVRTPRPLTSTEQMILDAFRAATIEGKADVLNLVRGLPKKDLS